MKGGVFNTSHTSFVTIDLIWAFKMEVCLTPPPLASDVKLNVLIKVMKY